MTYPILLVPGTWRFDQLPRDVRRLYVDIADDLAARFPGSAAT